VQVRPSASDPSSLLWTVGYGAIARIDLYYGSQTAPLNLDLTSCDRLRVNFSRLIGPLNFNIAVVQGNNGNIGADCGINLGAPGFNADVTAFTVDFPLSNFGRTLEVRFNGATSRLSTSSSRACPIWRSPSS
jgi:hypothetical protein